jgi:hypothetical protein
MELFFNGAGILKAEKGKYYIVDDVWEVYKEVDREEFIEELKKMSWVCLTTWDKGLRYDYLKLVDYVKEMK